MASIKKARKIKSKAEKAAQNVLTGQQQATMKMLDAEHEAGIPSTTPSPLIRHVGWRWHNSTFTYGILAIEGTHYFVRKSGLSEVWLVTKIEAQEVTYYVEVNPVCGVVRCSCKSQEHGGCKHVKALLALKACEQL